MRKSAVILASLLLQVAAQQECPGSSVPVLTDQSLEEAYGGSCETVEGDLVVGSSDCSSLCNLTSLSSLSRLRSVSGSLVIQCCHLLEDLTGLGQLTDIAGTLRIYYNQRLGTISGLNSVSSVENLEISQNGNLTRITGLSALETVSGHLQIDHNERLLNLDGLSGVSVIGGADLVAGHTLNILYNPSLTDLRWLRNLTQIQFGTVHIEGNSALCYSGYPQWSVGGFTPRPPEGDRGIDWRRVLGAGVPEWQYSWEAEGGGYPTLVVQNNAAYKDCSEARCHERCEEGAGCLGPLNSDLCGSCDEGFCEIGATPTMTSCDPTSIPYWPPTEFPYSLVFGVLFAFCGLVLLCLVSLGVCVMHRTCKRLRSGRKDTFEINEEMEMVGVELGRMDTDRSGIIAGTSSSLGHSSRATETTATAETTKEKSGNVVLTLMSYKPLDDTPDSQPTNAPVVTPPPPPTSTAVTPHTLTTAPPPPALSAADTKGSLQSIPEEMEEEEGGKRESTDGDTPVRKLHKHDTLTRLQKGESAHVQMVFPRSHVKLKKEIGKGEFGLVFFAEAKKLMSGEKKTPVIVKQLKEDSSKLEQENFLRPVEAMSLLLHSNVLSLLGACVDGPPIMILMEYCSHGNLKTYLVRKRREAAVFREGGRLVDISCQMAAGLTYLHSNSIAHNDFAVRSCLVSDTETVKLGDYGLTRQVFAEDYYSRGAGQKAWPVRWMPPEQIIVRGNTVLDSHPTSAIGNIWSFGVSLWEVSTLAQWPYFDLSNEEVIDAVQSSWQCTLENPFQSSDLLSPLYDIMQRCWKKAEERPTMVDVVKQLETLRDDIARNTPSSRKRRSISLSRSPKTTPKSTPPEARLQQAPQITPLKATPTQPRPDSHKTTPTQLPSDSNKSTPTEPRPNSNKTVPTQPRPAMITTPKTTPPVQPHPNTSSDPPKASPPQKASSTAGKKRGGKSYAPRRPAPKVPNEGSLKRGSTIVPVSTPISAHHQHPLEKSVKVDTEKLAKEDEEEDEVRRAEVAVPVKENPGFVEEEGGGGEIMTGAAVVSGGDGGVEEGGVFFENTAAAEEEEEARQTDNGVRDAEMEMERAGEWDMGEEEEGGADQQEWADEDFILEPPIDFSQPGVEDDEEFPQGGSHDLYNPDESQCTSIDDFEPIPQLPPSPKPSPKPSIKTHHTHTGVGFSTAPALASESDKQKKKKKKKEDGSRRRDRKRGRRGDGTQASPLLTYHTPREHTARGTERGRGWNEREEEEDALYRRPTGDISSALLKRAPSWGRSGKGETEGDLPNVVYDDEVAALIW